MSRLMVFTVLVLGCGKPQEPVVIEPPLPPVERKFVPDAVADGAALFTRAELKGSELEVTVVGKKLGAVLGYAFRLQVDGATASGDGVAVEALGPNAFGEALYFSRGTSIGAARQGAAAGARTIDDETVLARMRIAVGDAAVQLKLTDTSVRRANGDGVVVALGGGQLGGAR